MGSSSDTTKPAAAKKRKTLVRPGKIDVKAYNEVVANARLVDLRLVSCRSEIKVDALDGDRSGWELKVGDNLEEAKFEEEKSLLRAQLVFKAECVDGASKPLIVEGSYLVTYRVEGEVDAASAKLFVARVARFACYPYFRTLCASLLGQSNIVLPPLPVLKEAPRAIPRKKGKVTSSTKPAARAASKPSSPSIRVRRKT